MLILADENIDYPVIKTLRKKGFEIISILEEKPSISDENVLDFSIKIGAILLTNNKDFGDLVVRQGLPHSGIILLRLKKNNLDEISQIIINVLTKFGENLTTQFTVIRDKDVKIRII
jgi:predicted nuclease of predicted toxin-antitoxin system